MKTNTADISVLIERTKEGDHEAFAVLVSSFHDTVYYLALGKVRSEEDAEDIAQETFLEVYRTLNQLRTPAAFPAWIRKIATNRAYSRLRYRQAHPETREEGLLESVGGAETEFPGVDPHELPGLLLRAIVRLPEAYQMTVMLHYLEKRSPQAISQELGINPNTVRVTLHRGADYLRESLADVLREKEDRVASAN